MSEPPFGFNVPRQPDDDSGAEGGGGGEGQQGADGLFGDPQQFAEALRQFADLMAYQGGPVNWELAKNAARQTIAAHGDPSVLSNERTAVVEATMPVWITLCQPIADRAVETMGGLFTVSPEDLEDLPPELRSAMEALTGGAAAAGPSIGGLGALGGLGEMMRRVGGMMVGGQAGAAVGALAEEIIGSSDIGLPLGPEGTAALLPAGVAAFGAGLSVDLEEVRLFLALREVAHHRLFSHVPWLRPRLLGAVEDYARGITVDAAAMRDMMPRLDPANP